MSKQPASGDQHRAQLALDTSPIYDLHDLSVEHLGEALLITGRVSSFYHKQLVQEIVRTVVKGAKVVNSVDVG
ncbi:MAG: hypothetical protein A2W31_13695 [Planctomycetes bacterium RBG_16_64_10]|nr:MAG: hypothetical protein A2W31_13695 [Planctomycetes bacterium RBG_16_64_10]